jgi:hypothetical protein
MSIMSGLLTGFFNSLMKVFLKYGFIQLHQFVILVVMDSSSVILVACATNRLGDINSVVTTAYHP